MTVGRSKPWTAIFRLALAASLACRALGETGTEGTTTQVTVRSDPLFDRSFLELPLKTPAPVDGTDGLNPKHRLLAHRLRTALDERRIEELWHLRSTNETVLDFSVSFDLTERGPTWVLFDPLWCWGPDSTWWMLYGPGSIQRRDSVFPEFGRHYPSAFFRRPGTLPFERWDLVPRDALLVPVKGTPPEPGLRPESAAQGTGRPQRAVP